MNLYLASCADCNEIYGEEIISRIINIRINKILKSYNKSLKEFHSILKFENIPDFSILLQTNKINFNEILKLRNSNKIKDFREWLSGLTTETPEETIRKYCKESFPENYKNTPSKWKNVIVYFVLGKILSLIPVGGNIADIGLNIYDKFIKDKILGGYKPKVFIEEIKKSINI